MTSRSRYVTFPCLFMIYLPIRLDRSTSRLFTSRVTPSLSGCYLRVTAPDGLWLLYRVMLIAWRFSPLVTPLGYCFDWCFRWCKIWSYPLFLIGVILPNNCHTWVSPCVRPRGGTTKRVCKAWHWSLLFWEEIVTDSWTNCICTETLVP